MKVTDKCDVYRFGVVALEVVMGKHPGELLASLSSPSLSSTSATLSDSQELLLKDVLDQRLSPPTGQLAKTVVFVVTIALACTRSTPESRPTMRFVAQELSDRTHNFPSEPFGTITFRRLISDFRFWPLGRVVTSTY